MALEIERKFVVKIDGPAVLKQADKSIPIIQAYLKVTDDEELRIRKKGPKYIVTSKQGKGLVRKEEEREVTAAEGKKLLASAPKQFQVIKKVRFEFGRWELDVFQTPRLPAGIGIAEIELKSKTEKMPPVPKGITIIKEVTEDKRFKNKNIAKTKRFPSP